MLPTPLQRLSALESKLPCGPLYLKRDDLTGFGLAGNKARPLEFLLGDAVAQSADVLVAVGGPGSHFVAAAALAAEVCGLDCEILVAGAAPPRLPVTLELATRAGASVQFCGADREDLDQLVESHAEKLRSQGRTPYPLPRGGATAVGALGFARAARELAAQLAHAGYADHDEVIVVLPTGSGASLAGLLAGRAAIGAGWRTYGISVSRPAEQLVSGVFQLAEQCAALLDGPAPSKRDLRMVDNVGAGFGRVTEADRTSVLLAFRSEGILVDPTYGAKAVTAVQELRAFGERAPIVLWQTGGLPSALQLLATAEEWR
jgi:D-cysteine desulfhydrase